MARHRGAVCRGCRQVGLKLYLKGERCYSDKCAFGRRGYRPGQHGKAPSKHSDYGLQLQEKQKVKMMYGILERQFQRYFEEAERKKGITGENLLTILERRLDNVVYRLGLANSCREARQLVRHNHILVDGKRVNIPSYLVREGNVISVREKSKNNPIIKEALESVARRGIPSWLELDKEKVMGRVLSLPQSKEITIPIRKQLIFELCSR